MCKSSKLHLNEGHTNTFAIVAPALPHFLYDAKIDRQCYSYRDEKGGLAENPSIVIIEKHKLVPRHSESFFCFVSLRLQTWSMQSWKGILKARRSSWWVIKSTFRGLTSCHNAYACFCFTVLMNKCLALPSQDEVGVETDEDCKVVVPSTWKNK